MAADDFVMVIPPTWVELTGIVAFINTIMAESEVHAMIAQNDLYNLSVYLIGAELLPDGALISEARLIATGDPELPFRIWYKLA